MWTDTLLNFRKRSYRKDSLHRRYHIEYGPYLKLNPSHTSESFYKRIFLKAKRYINPNSKILDIGCGLGRLAIDYSNCLPLEVYGIDNDLELINEASDIARNLNKKLLTYPSRGNVKFLRCSVRNMPFSNCYFSLISCINLIDRIESPNDLIDDLYQLLTPGGVLIISDPYDWDNTITPLSEQVKDIKDLLSNPYWKILYEEDNIPYNISINQRRKTCYSSHLVIAQKI